MPTTIPFTILNTSAFSYVTNVSMTTIAPPTNAFLDPCSIPPAPINLAGFICMILFIPITVFGNLLVIVVVLVSPTLRKQSTYLFLTSLAIADLLVGVISMPLKSKVHYNNSLLCIPQPEIACWSYMLSEIILSVTSSVHLLVIGIDRFISLKYTYLYNELMTRKKLYITIASIWGFSISLGLLGIFKWNQPSKFSISYDSSKNFCGIRNPPYFITVYVFVFFIPIIIMMYTYTHVYRTAVRHIKEIAKVEIISNTNETALLERDIRCKKRQFRTFRSIIVVLIVFIICWIPTIIFLISIQYATVFWKPYTKTAWFIALYFILVVLMPPLNSTTNPFIYVLWNKQFRNELEQLFAKFTAGKRAFVASSMTQLFNAKIYNSKDILCSPKSTGTSINHKNNYNESEIVTTDFTCTQSQSL